MTSGQYSFVATYVCMSPQSEIALWPPGLVPPVFPGARKRARTADNRVFSAGLYQLSYTSVSGLIASAFGCYPVRSHACCPEILVVRASPHQASLCFGLALHPFPSRRSKEPAPDSIVAGKHSAATRRSSSGLLRWYPLPDSNRQPLPSEGSALPLRQMGGLRGSLP
jgi:hypothetical protein